MAALTGLKSEERLLDRLAADRIRQQIVTGAMSPGHRLLEASLARDLEVSRGTIRSALMQLSNQGLVRQVAFTKWEVAEASAAEAWELYTLRAVLEELAAGLAARSASAGERERLAEIANELQRAVEADDHEAAMDADFAMHRAIVSMSGHRHLIADHERIILQVRFQMFHIGFTPRDFNDLIAGHRALADAVVSGDVERAKQLARDHNSAEVQRLLEASMEQAKTEAVGRNTPAENSKEE